jgi:hypothetical protein
LQYRTFAQPSLNKCLAEEVDYFSHCPEISKR